MCATISGMSKEPSERAVKANAAYQRARKRADEAREELHAALVADLADGVRQVDLVNLTGYTREHLRKLAKSANA